MKPSGNNDAFEKKLKRLINKLEGERQALGKILISVANDSKSNKSNK